MNKQMFMEQLRGRLSGLPQRDLEERLSFYGEMIEDRIEEGLSEEEAVAAVGSVDEIVGQIIEEVPLVKIAGQRIKKHKRLKAWEIVLLALGSPIWLSLAVAAVSVLASLYCSLWAVIAALWAVLAATAALVWSVAVCGISSACNGNLWQAAAFFGAALLGAGLWMFLLLACRASTKGTVLLTKKTAICIKNRLIGKEETQ